MSSSGCESEPSLDSKSSSSSNESLHLESGDEDVGVVNSVINSYENEPLANPADDENSSMDGEEDEDGIDPRTLEARLEGEITLDHW
jgi:hypothetical protein